MRPIAYEIKRTLSSKFVILIVIAIIGLSTLLAYESGSTARAAPISVNDVQVSYGFYFSQNSSLNLVMFGHNGYGSPSSGVSVNVFYGTGELTSSTNREGFANFSLPSSANISQLSYNYTYHFFGISRSTAVKIPIIISDDTFSGYNVIPGIIDRSNDTRFGFIVMYVGPNGSKAPSTSIYVSTYFPGESPTFAEANKTFVVSQSNFNAITVFPYFPSATINDTFEVVLSDPTVPAVASSSSSVSVFPIGKLSSYTPITSTQLQSLVFSGTGSILGFLIPLLAVFSGYLTYSKDKTSGVLESVLKRPVTRGDLISSRFLANSVAIIGSVIVSMAIGDLFIKYYFATYLSPDFFLFFVWAYITEGLAFLGLVYLFTHLVKSQGSILGIALVLFVVFDLFWSIIPVAVEAGLGITGSSAIYIPTNIGFDLASPSGFSSLVQFYFQNTLGSITSSVQANPASYSINAYTLIIIGLVWIIVPFVIALSLARSRD